MNDDAGTPGTGIKKKKRGTAIPKNKWFSPVYIRSIICKGYSFLSLGLRGMSFIDMAYLTYENLRGEHITYYRRKTGGRLDIRWEQQMQSIIDKYPKDSRYLLPILTNDADDRQTYKKLSKRINRHLRQVGEMVQLPIPLTLYVARHSWASIAKQKQIPISVISDALGHDSEKTTLIYLSTLDTSAVDNANSEILAALGEW